MQGCIQVSVDEIRDALNERQALLDNLKSTQERCSELLEENRALKRELAQVLVTLDCPKKVKNG